MGAARVFLQGQITVWVEEGDIEKWDGYSDAVRTGMSKEEILTNVALLKIDPNKGDEVQIQAGEAQVDQKSDTIDWESLLHPASASNLDDEEWHDSTDVRARPPNEALGSRRVADSNPAVRMADECLKVAKTLSNLLNELAGLSNREEIAASAGLQQLPESIERLYELADQYRAGGVQNLQIANAGWDPDKLVRQARPFVDEQAKPMETVQDDAEKFRFPRERTSTPVDAPMDK